MKKILILCFSFSFGPFAFCQPLFEVPLGSSSNQNSCSNGQWTNLWYDADIHSILFSHRSNDQIGWPTSGFVVGDYSTDDGATWLIDQGPVYSDSLNLFRARFPQGAIYNPPGNIIPSNAFFTTFGEGFDGVGYTGYFSGSVPLASSSPAQSIFPFASTGFNSFNPKGGMIVKNTGTAWWSAEGLNGSDYNDTIIISKGTFNSAIQQFTYSFQKIYAPVKSNLSGNKIFFNQAIAFNDAGNIGYIALLGNDWVNTTLFSDSAMGIIIYASNDSGNTWNRLSGISLNGLDPLLLNNGTSYQAGFDFDIGVDKNNDLHIVLPIIPHQIDNGISTINIPAYHSWGLFDISTSNGYTWNGCPVEYPETFIGEFGSVPLLIEDNRPQFSRSWDGSKLFFTWFDTDTLVYGPGLNEFPDMHSIGYDVDQNMWTNVFNFTEGTGLHADGRCYFGNVSYYSMNDGVNENIPMVFDSLSNGITDPVYYYFLGGAAVSGYTNQKNCITLINTVAENPAPSPGFYASTIYPNPFRDKAFIDVTPGKNSAVTIEITNALGQIFSSLTYQNISTGKNTLAIDASNLCPGFYFYTVKAGNDAVTKMLSVE